MPDKITREMLEDGSVLVAMKKAFLENRSQETLGSLLACLRDSVLIVPLTVTMSERDEEKFKNGKEGDEIQCEDEVHLKPDVFKTEDGSLFFPAFSQQEQMPEEYAANFSKMPFDIFKCLEMAHAIEGVGGIVLDPLTEPVSLPLEIADMIEKFPSMISE